MKKIENTIDLLLQKALDIVFCPQNEIAEKVKIARQFKDNIEYIYETKLGGTTHTLCAYFEYVRSNNKSKELQ